MSVAKNLIWLILAASLVTLVVLSRDWSYAKDVVGALEAPAAAGS